MGRELQLYGLSGSPVSTAFIEIGRHWPSAWVALALPRLANASARLECHVITVLASNEEGPRASEGQDRDSQTQKRRSAEESFGQLPLRW